MKCCFNKCRVYQNPTKLHKITVVNIIWPFYSQINVLKKQKHSFRNTLLFDTDYENTAHSSLHILYFLYLFATPNVVLSTALHVNLFKCSTNVTEKVIVTWLHGLLRRLAAVREKQNNNKKIMADNKGLERPKGGLKILDIFSLKTVRFYRIHFLHSRAPIKDLKDLFKKDANCCSHCGLLLVNNQGKPTKTSTLYLRILAETRQGDNDILNFRKEIQQTGEIPVHNYVNTSIMS